MVKVGSPINISLSVIMSVFHTYNESATMHNMGTL